MRISAAAFAEAGKQYLGRTYREMDCQAFVEAAMERAGICMNLAGSNAWYRKMTWTGTPEECKARFGAVPVGALLYILERDGKEPAKYKPDGVGNASHMGVKTGTGKGAIHSSASRGGVCESEFHDKTVPNGGWNRVGLWDAFDYGEAVNALLAADDEPDDADPPDGGDARMATVYADNGKPVKLRSRPLADDKKTTWDWVPVGATVTLRALPVDGWTPVRYKGREGYMMDKFLRYGSAPDREETEPDSIIPPSVTEDPRGWLVSNLTEDDAREIVKQYPEGRVQQAHG